MTEHKQTPVWQFGDRRYLLTGRTLVMGIINVTPDSFSDGGQFTTVDAALDHAVRMVADGADILDIGGESTRPGGATVSVSEELDRVLPVVTRLVAELDVPISVDTTKREVARAALSAGAEIINDISGLRFEPELADTVAEHSAGLILMHSRGAADALHSQPPVEEIFVEVLDDLRRSMTEAERRGVGHAAIVLDPGIGFGKTYEQNLSLVANFSRLLQALPGRGWLVGTSRKSFIGKALGDLPPAERLFGTMATMVAAVLAGAHIVRVHDVKEAVTTVRMAEALRDATNTEPAL